MAINESALQRLLDERDIRDCVTRYARGIDRHDVALIESAFHPDSQDHHGGDTRSREDLAEWGNELHATHTRRHSHFLANSTVDIDGDTAHTETYFAVANNNQHGPLFGLAGGRYADRFERRDGRWAIAVRKCVAEWDSTPGIELVDRLTEAFVSVGKLSRDRSDLSYQRPSTVASERLGTWIPV